LWSASDLAFRRLADDGRHFTDPAVQFAGIFVGIVNAAPVVIPAAGAHGGAALDQVRPRAARRIRG